ncbi:tRNA uridine-5-carboxymethylaminomethyl(34) synthesis GTPase MnmE [Clostridia bacterium]|nr:tRNA uridine-5-carboxymethylaminomethyl(34) synthesis GTPase MnmE [Clostridia bacterium]
METTVAAIATSPGQSGIGIIRISGKDSLSVLESLFVPLDSKRWKNKKPWQFYLGHIMKNDKSIDEVLVVFMKSPKSYTGEDVVEIHSHGGMLVQRQILEILLETGVSAAEPGEFTKRAFLNGRLDLVQAESVIDIIEANNEQGLTAANSQLQGRLSRGIEELSERLLKLIAYYEAALDFPDDEIDAIAEDKVIQEVTEVKQRIGSLIESYKQGKMMKDGINTTIIGKPNVGKSSLLNVLLQESRAIVTDIPGTTRDTIEEILNLGGISLRITDTAGIHETEDVVEKIGVEKSIKALEQSDLVLLVLDVHEGIDELDKVLLQRVEELGKPYITVWNKADLLSKENIPEWLQEMPESVAISAKNDEGIEELVETIKRRVSLSDTSVNSQQVITRARHYELLLKAEKELKNFLESSNAHMPMDFLSIDLRSALESLDEILGKNTAEDIFDTIFQEFCLGK